MAPARFGKCKIKTLEVRLKTQDLASVFLEISCFWRYLWLGAERKYMKFYLILKSSNARGFEKSGVSCQFKLWVGPSVGPYICTRVDCEQLTLIHTVQAGSLRLNYLFLWQMTEWLLHPPTSSGVGRNLLQSPICMRRSKSAGLTACSDCIWSCMSTRDFQHLPVAQ